MIMISRGCVAALGLVGALAAPAEAQVLRLAEIDAAAVARLDRARTVVIIPGPAGGAAGALAGSGARAAVALRYVHGCIPGANHP